jgi:hypothetical protein
MGAVAISRTRSGREIPLAAFPLLFGIQQLVEGALWLRLESQITDWTTSVLAHGFLTFAEIVWPILVPISALLDVMTVVPGAARP